MTTGSRGEAWAGSAPTIVERVTWLFAIVPAVLAPDPDEGAESVWRPYSNREVGLALGHALGLGPLEGVTLIEQIRAGQETDERSLTAVARFFGADAAYFGEDLDAVRVEQEKLLVTALRACAATTIVLCRSPALATESRRVRLERLLDLLRERREGAEGVTRPERRSDTVEAGSSARLNWHYQGTDEGHPPSAPGRPGGTRGEVDVAPLSGQELRQLCVRLLRDLDIVPPLTPELLCERLGDQRGRQIKLRAEEVFTTSSVGHLICKPRHDVIIYQRTAPRLLQAHVIYHEIIHLIRGHLDGSESLTCGALDPGGDTGDSGLYSHWQEWEAETGATVLTELAQMTVDPRAIGRRSPGREGGLAATFGLRPGGWPG